MIKKGSLVELKPKKNHIDYKSMFLSLEKESLIGLVLDEFYQIREYRLIGRNVYKTKHIKVFWLNMPEGRTNIVTNPSSSVGKTYLNNPETYELFSLRNNYSIKEIKERNNVD